MQSQTDVWRSRVSSSLGIVLGAAVAAAAVAWTGTAEAQTKTLKMQSTWPASLTLQDNFKFFGERVEKLTGGTLKIETHGCRPDRAAVRDPGRHQQEGDRWRPRHLLLLGRQEQGRHAVLQHAGRHRRHGPDGLHGLDLRGGGLEMWWDFYQKDLKLNVVAFPILPASPQALGWFRKPIQSVEDFKGMKCRQTGIVGEIYKRMGMNTVNMPGGEIVPSAERGVIDCAEWVGGIEDLRLGLPQVWKYHYTPGLHEMTLDRRADHQQGGVGRPHAAAAGGDPLGDDRDLRALVGEMAEAECRCHRGDADQARHADPAHPAGDPDRVLQGLGRDRQGGDGGQPVLQEGLRVAEGLRGQGGAGQALHVPALLVRRRTTTSRRSRASDPRNWQEIEGRLRVAAAPFQFSKGGDGAR